MATFVVNSTDDLIDTAPGDGVAEAGLGTGMVTLRAAIMEANALFGPDTIDVPAGTYTLTIEGRLENAAEEGDLDITDDVTITGAGAASTIIDAAGIDRVFQFHFFTTVNISDVTITGGLATDDGFTAGLAQGGGIHDFLGRLNISGSSIINNQAIGEDGRGAQGGGLYSSVTTGSITQTTISDNRAMGSAGGPGTPGADAQGGGIYNEGSTWSIENSTLSGNIAVGGEGGAEPGSGGVGGNGGDGKGGGIHAGLGASMSVVHATIAQNQASGGSGGGGTTGGASGTGEAGGVFSDFAGIDLHNTIIATNTATSLNADVSGAFFSSGYNLIGDGTGSTGFVALGDQVGTSASPIDPLLEPLRDNGGLTLTHELMSRD